jgi:hypothetical protein
MKMQQKQLAIMACIGVAGATASSVVAAQDAAISAPAPPATATASAPATKKIQSVIVAGHYINAIGTSDAASEGTVTAELIASRQAMRTGEMLEFVPGMIVTQHSGDGKANQYFLRGFNLDHGTDFASYVDGMPVNMRSNVHGQGYSDLNFLMPELVQRIDYKKGPYFADEGDFASAGAAHFQLVDTLSQGLAEVTTGSYGYQRAVMADSFSALDGTLLYGLELGRNNGPWDTPEDVRKYSATLRYSAGTKQDGYSITAMAYKNSWNATNQIPLRAVEEGLIDRFGAIDPTDGGQTSRYSLSYAMHQRSDERIVEFDAYAIRSTLSLFNDFTYFLDNTVLGDQFNQQEHRTVGGFNASEAWPARVAGFEMRNKVGIQTRYDFISPLALYETTARQRTSVVEVDTVKEASAGLYWENTVYWLPTFRSIAGLRYDAYHFDVSSSIAGDSGVTGAHKASPKLSLIFGPWARTEYFVNYGTGFHSNDARGTTQTRLPDGNPSAPVTPLVGSRGAELGARTEIIPGLQSSLAVWALDLESELTFGGDTGDTEPSRPSRRTGIEWSNHYIAAPWLLFDLDLATSHARYTQNDPIGNDVPEALGKMASFGVTIKDIGRWYAGFNLRYFGPRPLIEDDSVRSSSTTLASARLGYHFNARTRLTLDSFNLFNRQANEIDYYYQSRLKGESAVGASDDEFHPVEPRTVRLTLAHNF